MDLFSKLRQLLGLEVVSPLPKYQSLTDPQTMRYVAEQQQAEAHPRQPDVVNKTLQYPDWLANAPRKEVKGAQTQAQPIVEKAQAAEPVSPTQSALEQAITQGMHDYSPNAPVSTMAAALAKAGMMMPQKNPLDKYLPVLISLIETSGGRNMTRGYDNIYNMNANTGGVNYPDLQTAILGGGEHQGLTGILSNPTYADFQKTGNLEDLLKHFTPPNDNNATMERQLHRYNDLYNTYFKKYLE